MSQLAPAGALMSHLPGAFYARGCGAGKTGRGSFRRSSRRRTPESAEAAATARPAFAGTYRGIARHRRAVRVRRASAGTNVRIDALQRAVAAAAVRLFTDPIADVRDGA